MPGKYTVARFATNSRGDKIGYHIYQKGLTIGQARKQAAAMNKALSVDQLLDGAQYFAFNPEAE